MKVLVKVYFNQTIDNDEYQFTNRREAIAVAQGLAEHVGNFKFSRCEDYLWLNFQEFIFVEIEEDGKPLSYHIWDVKPTFPGGVYSCHRTVVKHYPII